MNRKDIITLPDAKLREKSKKVSRVDEKTRQLVDDLIEAALDWEDHREHELSVGLAAVQVGLMQRVVVIREDQEDRSKKDFIPLINPKLIRGYGKLEYDFEGCLSVADIYGKVPRYPKIKIEAQDVDGETFRLTAEGFMARLIQHEIDHTNGIVFIDHIKDEDEFYQINKHGKIEKLDYDQDIKDSRILWD